MKVIFLDFDGVICNAAQWKREFRDEYGQPFCPAATAQLARVLTTTGARVVVSSTWRLSGLTVMRELWAARKMPGSIYSITPHRDQQLPSGLWMGGVRGHEIKDWINAEDYDHPLTHYVILDDMGPDAFLDEQRPYFVQTDADDGLTREHADRAIAILNA